MLTTRKLTQTNQKNQQKSNAIRTCIACGKKSSKKDFLRFTLDEKGNLTLDAKGKVAGRGANLCPSVECFDSAIKKDSFNRAFRRNIKKEDIEKLRQVFKDAI